MCHHRIIVNQVRIIGNPAIILQIQKNPMKNKITEENKVHKEKIKQKRTKYPFNKSSSAKNTLGQ